MKKLFLIFSWMIVFGISFMLTSYVDAASQRSFKWTNPKGIKTYIPPKHRHTPMMKRAFAEWSRKTNNKIVFRYVGTKTEADIVVRYFDKIEDCGETNNAIGCARYTGHSCTQSACKFRFVYIDIADETVNGRDLSDKVEVYTTMLHEIGHAIGLKHNETNKYSIMSVAPNRSVLKQEIDRDDLNQLAEIYGW